MNGGAETRLLGPIQTQAGWVPDQHGIYFIEPARRSRITGLPLATSRRLPLAKEPGVLNAGLALSPDGRWLLYAQLDRSGADIMLVENFR